ncbi:Methionine-R-sulfoxide reductase B1-A [Bulinus truncatus]|nr:Methionine-R-sulfoxide reductase B1-A [Bulinus truncatus]
MSFCTWSKAEYFRDHFETGIYACAKCGNELFSSHSKYKHETPWPAFTQTIHPESVRKIPESPSAIKIVCACRGRDSDEAKYFLEERKINMH